MDKKWIVIWFSALIIVPIVALFNYIIDPYNIYNSNIINLQKSEQINYGRLIKSIKIRENKPKSIILGTSRAEGAFDPTHQYFLQPSYNAATAGSSMYENLKYLELAIHMGNLKQVLLVADYRMFNGINKKRSVDFDTYFDNDFNKYKYLFSIDTFVSSLKTIKKQNKEFDIFLDNGLKESLYPEKQKEYNVLEAFFNIEKEHYKGYTPGYKYLDAISNPFDDFIKFIELCYQNNIKLEIIFGPSHIRLWESLDYYIGYNYWLQWKNDIVETLNNIAEKYSRKEYPLVDFSIYHPLTSEKVPFGLGQMKYYNESSHYKKILGDIVLNKLSGISSYNNFGKQITKSTITQYLVSQKKNRKIFIDSKEYKKAFIQYLKVRK